MACKHVCAKYAQVKNLKKEQEEEEEYIICNPKRSDNEQIENVNIFKLKHKYCIKTKTMNLILTTRIIILNNHNSDHIFKIEYETNQISNHINLLPNEQTKQTIRV